MRLVLLLLVVLVLVEERIMGPVTTGIISLVISYIAPVELASLR